MNKCKDYYIIYPKPRPRFCANGTYTVRTADASRVHPYGSNTRVRGRTGTTHRYSLHLRQQIDHLNRGKRAVVSFVARLASGPCNRLLDIFSRKYSKQNGYAGG